MSFNRLIVVTVVAGVVGAVIFWVFQLNVQGATITSYIGGQVVKKGGYSLSPVFVGWSIHIGVSISYALLMGLVMWIPFTENVNLNRAITLLIAVFLGWITTIVAPPAINVTINLLSGKGFPSGPFWWNHQLFFIVVWAIFMAAPFVWKKKS